MQQLLPLTSHKEPLTYEETQAEIGARLSKNQPFFVGRMGSTELRAALRVRVSERPHLFDRQLALLANKSFPGPVSFVFRKLQSDSGFYPLTKSALADFVNLLELSMPAVDLLGSWVKGESFFARGFSGANVTHLEYLEPFWSATPWTAQLQGLRVLVIHPFSKTIEYQYRNARSDLFSNSLILPDFELSTLSAVQSLGRPDPRFGTWFEALDWMTDEALDRSFDVAIVGCGAYGFPLSARLKAAGKKVLHLGGLTQLLFGIRGRRWDSDSKYAPLWNSKWVRATEDEIPPGHTKLGQNSYW